MNDGYVLLMGDLSSRIGGSNDNLEELAMNDMYMGSDNNGAIQNRQSSDQIIMYGRKLLDLCHQTNLIISNGRK